MTNTGGFSGPFANTHGARAERGEVPAEIVAAGERMDELRKAAEPLRAYLMKYGDPYTVIVVRQDCATETQEGRYVTFREEMLAEQEAREAEFLREIEAAMGNGETA